MATMKAARWHAAKDVRIEEVEVPEVQPHQVKVAVKFTGICGTDLHEYLDGPIFIPTEEHVYSGQKAPVTLGHEFSGEIVEAIHRLTGGGADVSYEVTGVPVVLGQALAAVHKAGECMVVSIWEREASINPNEFAIQEKSLKGIIAYRHIFPKVLELMEQGYFSAEKLVTKKIKLENIVEEGFVELTQDKSQIKILVQPE